MDRDSTILLELVRSNEHAAISIFGDNPRLPILEADDARFGNTAARLYLSAARAALYHRDLDFFGRYRETNELPMIHDIMKHEELAYEVIRDNNLAFRTLPGVRPPIAFFAIRHENVAVEALNNFELISMTINGYGETLLDAIIWRHPKIANGILSNSLLLVAKNENGSTAAHTAVWHHQRVAYALLDRPDVLKLTDNMGRSVALAMAVRQPEIALGLLNYEDVLNMKDYYFNTTVGAVVYELLTSVKRKEEVTDAKELDKNSKIIRFGDREIVIRPPKEDDDLSFVLDAMTKAWISAGGDIVFWRKVGDKLPFLREMHPYGGCPK